VQDNFVRPFVAGFPGNVHSIRNLAHAKNLVAGLPLLLAAALVLLFPKRAPASLGS